MKHYLSDREDSAWIEFRESGCAQLGGGILDASFGIYLDELLVLRDLLNKHFAMPAAEPRHDEYFFWLGSEAEAF